MPVKDGLIGVPGLSIWSGVLGEEYLKQLQGTKKVKIFLEMIDDPIIGALLEAMTMPLMAAEFSVNPADENNETDQAASEFVESCMNDMSRYSWRQHVLDMLGMLSWGWSVSEVAFKKRMGEYADPSSAYDDGRLGLHILDPRGQETLYNWKFDEQYNVEAMVQQDPNTGKLLTIDALKMIHVTFRSRKRSPEGTSPLRSLYKPWYMRKNLEIIEAIGAERDLAGLPVIQLPSGATTADKEAAQTIVRNIRLDEEAGVVLPAPPPGSDKGWVLSLLSSGGSKQFNVREIVRDLNKIILMRFFAQFLMLGMEQVGTQALVKGSHDFFSLALTSVQAELLEAWNQQLVPLMLKYNPFRGRTRYPKIDWAPPGKDDVAGVAQMLSNLVGINVITPGPDIEDWVRKMAGLPDRPEGVGTGPRGPMAPPTPFPIQNPALSYDWEAKTDGSWVAKPRKAPAYGTGFFANSRRESGYADVAGTAGRRARGNLERATNEYQGQLVMAYDIWAAATEKLMTQTTEPDKAKEILRSRLPLLAQALKEVGRKGILVALQLGMGGVGLDPAALDLAKDRVAENEQFIDQNLIPRIQQTLEQFVDDSVKTYASPSPLLASPMLVAALESLKGQVAGYAGAFWSASFMGAGHVQVQEDAARVAVGEKPRRVRWVLDPNAQHCHQSPGFYGCEDLAGEYDQWDDLPTVPAGQVTCRGHCRCMLEVRNDNGQWERVA